MASHLVTATVQAKHKAAQMDKVVETKTVAMAALMVNVQILAHALVATTKIAQTVRARKVKVALKVKANQQVNANQNVVNSIELEC